MTWILYLRARGVVSVFMTDDALGGGGSVWSGAFACFGPSSLWRSDCHLTSHSPNCTRRRTVELRPEVSRETGESTATQQQPHRPPLQPNNEDNEDNNNEDNKDGDNDYNNKAGKLERAHPPNNNHQAAQTNYELDELD